jgi:hypothetical protein
MKANKIVWQALIISTMLLLGACAAKESPSSYAEQKTESAAPDTLNEVEAADTQAPDAPKQDKLQDELQDNKPAKQRNKEPNRSLQAETNAFDTLGDLKLPRKRFIKTATLRGVVADVVWATETAENIAQACGGFVTNSSLQNIQGYNSQIAINKDSLWQINRLNAQVQLNLAVPQQHLDSTLRQLARLFQRINERNITAQDVSITLLDDKMKAFANYQSQKRIANRTAESNKLTDIVAAEDAIVNRQLAAIKSQIQNLRLNDQILYATITVTMVQPETIEKIKILNTYKQEQPPFAYLFTGRLPKQCSCFL